MKYCHRPVHIAGVKSPSMRREWIEILMSLLERRIIYPSPSMRREWIEMISHIKPLHLPVVSLHAEGVD